MIMLKTFMSINGFFLFKERQVLIICLLGCLVITACDKKTLNLEKVEVKNQPNIILILLDDLGYGDLSYLGSEIKTPHIDQLAGEGLILDRAYVFPICSPTRAALLTGQNPIKFGVDGPMEHDAQLPSDLTLLPEYMRQGGYKTWMVGKWHLGSSKQSAMPHSRGFDYFYGFLGGFIDSYTHVYFGGLDWQRNGKTVREEGYATHLLTRDVKKLLADHDGQKPFFLYLSYNSPHTPLQFPPDAKESYENIESPDRRVFAQMTTDVDAAIGEIMAALNEYNLQDNTLIVFMSDNGGNLEAGAFNGKLRGGKGSVYEGGLRVPTLVWSKSLASQKTYSQPFFVQDWLPTILDISGIEYDPSDFDGRSVWPGLLNNTPLEATVPVVVGTNKSKAVYDWPWKLVRTQVKADGSSTEISNQNEIYNVENDPLETQDLASVKPELVNRLGERLDNLSIGESKAATGPPPESLFRDSNGNFDHYIRKAETREPWADKAIADK